MFWFDGWDFNNPHNRQVLITWIVTLFSLSLGIVILIKYIKLYKQIKYEEQQGLNTDLNENRMPTGKLSVRTFKSQMPTEGLLKNAEKIDNLHTEEIIIADESKKETKISN